MRSFPTCISRLSLPRSTIQQGELGLPSTPLKPTEKRGDRWREEFGVEQTEIDALALFQPDVLRRIIETAIAPYFDRTLAFSHSAGG